MTTIYKDAVGLRVRVQTSINLVDTSPLTCKVLVQKPDGTTAEWAATVEAPASGGVIYHDTVDGDLDQAGSYKFQAQVRRSSDAAILPLGETATLEVHDPFN